MIRSQTFYHDLYINQGSTFQAELFLEDNAKQPFNLTGYVVRSVIRRNSKSETIDATFDCIISDYLSGNIFIALTPEQTNELVNGTYVYDIILEDTTGEKHKVVEGNVYVSSRITV